MIRINSHVTGAVLFRCQTATDLREALEDAARAGADLSNADLKESNLEGSDFRGAVMPGANLRWSNLTDCCLAEGMMARVKMDRAALINTDLSGAILTNAKAQMAVMIGADLAGADLRGSDFINSNLAGARLKGAKLDGAHFDGADLRAVDLKDVDINGSMFEGAKADIFNVLHCAHTEVPGLLKLVRAGEFQGQRYRYDEQGLTGTLMTLRGVGEALERNHNRVAERFCRAIQLGMTPKNNKLAKILEGWLEEYIAKIGSLDAADAA